MNRSFEKYVVNPLSVESGSLFLGVLLCFLLFPLSLTAASEYKKNLELFRQGKYTSIIDQTNIGDSNSIKLEDLYLHYKALIKKGKLEESEKIFEQMQSLNDTNFKSILSYEMFLRGIREENLGLILQSLRELPKGKLGRSHREAIQPLLFSKLKVNEVKREELRFLLEGVFRYEENSWVLIELMKSEGKQSKDFLPLLSFLWETSNIMKLEPQKRELITKLVTESSLGKISWLRHLKRQYKYGNHEYIFTVVKRLSRQDPATFSEWDGIVAIYKKSRLRKRQYSILLGDIKKDKNWLRVSEWNRLGWEFDLWLKKGKLKQVKRVKAQIESRFNIQSTTERLFQLGRYFLKKGKSKEGILYLEKYIATKNPRRLEEAKWSLFLGYQQWQDGDKVQKLFTWAKGHTFAKAAIGARFCYWGVKEKQYQDTGYGLCYQKYPKTFYGLRAHFMTRPESDIQLSETWQWRKDSEGVLSDKENALLVRFELLYAVGEPELADQLILEESENLHQAAFFLNLSAMLIKEQRFALVVRLINSYHYSQILNETKFGLTIKNLYYPLAYRKVVTSLANGYQVPELLVYSVMREESRFRPQVESSAGAKGLLQLMPKTAKYIGRLIKKPVQDKDLIRPAVNLEIGIAYLKRLLKRYKGNQFYALAAYNGGPTNVRRWRKKIKIEDEDYFLESISFQETKNYVKKVLRSYYNYQLLYGSSY
ncbi:MAG: hypothetical protein COB67_06470 [SAR324 cluster bacterium]|uniref:Transglycosylase SLT domain-containing protein n=1 Tax=SAR324 cluster bacterium TaxID=2024889 RepID=A0A2A4T509_9DELT|nr:MAG: hypothetical protein COB67_06470 [SAR324 cluster bacterium]